jgi:hypothetical protein
MLEGLNLGITKKEIKAAKPKTPEKKFNFKTIKRAHGAVDLNNPTAKYLDTLSRDRAVDLWKIYFIKRTHTAKQAENYKEICAYLSQKYGIDLPKRK